MSPVITQTHTQSARKKKDKKIPIISGTIKSHLMLLLTHPLLGTIPLKPNRLVLARACGLFLVLDGIEDVVPV